MIITDNLLIFKAEQAAEESRGGGMRDHEPPDDGGCTPSDSPCPSVDIFAVPGGDSIFTEGESIDDGKNRIPSRKVRSFPYLTIIIIIFAIFIICQYSKKIMNRLHQ